MLSPAGKLFRLQALGLCVALSLGNPIALVYAADVIQFNTDVLDINDRKNIDLSQFSAQRLHHAGRLYHGGARQ